MCHKIVEEKFLISDFLVSVKWLVLQKLFAHTTNCSTWNLNGGYDCIYVELVLGWAVNCVAYVCTSYKFVLWLV